MTEQKYNLNDVTLQINISPGDLAYAEQTIPFLLANHPEVENRLLIVDCCRPQKTKLLDPDVKFPLAAFNKHVEQLIAITEGFKAKGFFSSVYYLKPNDPLIKRLSKKYLRGVYDCTHGAGGTANMSYWAGIELTQTKFVLHYDSDILVHQTEGYDWAKEALDLMQQDHDCVAAVPRLTPPTQDLMDLPSFQEGRPNESHDSYWLNDFFSTRHFLLNRERLAQYFPLIRGKLLIELLLRKYFKRAFPLDPEIILFRSVGAKGGKRMVLKTSDAWILHPDKKGDRFMHLLPGIIKAVSEGTFPPEQAGYENINLEAWAEFLND